ncbi:gamma-glutamyl-gamma-aminobutyrate hydrolase family protein [Roseibium aestuarii]|uniref:Gamma-glutamyl-gamma-aminobutyrate hydrolase family protein n=1 Tax=Roseibium aestuarii TaxID=2600299 RepID=A0ABW4JV89_9HYPH|nr:type 1 glutamine amidotransferase [Roseibium aestuarii]
MIGPKPNPRRRPRIGVTTSRGGGRYMWWFYWIALRLAGARPVRLIAPASQHPLDRFDGFIIGGGDDISPDLYRGDTLVDARLDPERDRMELEVLAHAGPRDVPVLGVCRGAQMINVHQGGTLYQNVQAAFDKVPDMWTPLPVKTVTFKTGSRLKRLAQRETLRVNSLHHQAVDRVGEQLEIVAWDEFGVPQALENTSASFMIGVQWHPEFLLHLKPHRRLFRAFIKAVRTGMERGRAHPEMDATAGHQAFQ